MVAKIDLLVIGEIRTMLIQEELFQQPYAKEITDHGLRNLVSAILTNTVEESRQLKYRKLRFPDGQRVSSVRMSIYEFLVGSDKFWAQTLCDFENVDYDKLKRLCEVE